MDISGHERDMIPMPISSSYAAGFHGGYGHMRVHDSSTPSSHINSTQSPPLLLPSNGSISPDPDDHLTYKKLQVTIRYRECLKNHAAAMGGNATDGCGEFLPSGEEGTLESLKCSVCSCHRNFHRKETEGDHHHLKHSSCGCYSLYNPKARKLVVGQKGVLITPNSEAFGGYPTTGSEHMTTRPQQHYPQHHVIMSYNSMGHLPNSESDHDQEEGGDHGTLQQPNRPPDLVIKKRFRTRFTQEQKEKMLSFAERVGWRIQNQEDVVVKQFCQEIGVKRRVLKVWMHNNKHNQLAKKNSSTT